MNMACSGLAPNTKLDDWLKLAGDNEKLRNGMERLFNLFEKAPILGSLINPRHSADDMFVADYHEVSSLLEQALQSESTSSFILHPSSLESAVTARGLAKAAEILSGQFTLVATNVPFLGMNRQSEVLFAFLKSHYPAAKADLATVFIQRCVDLCYPGATTAVVSPQIWLFLGSYKAFRTKLLEDRTWHFVARLGPGAFDSISGEVVNVGLFVLSKTTPSKDHLLSGLDVSAKGTATGKANLLETASPVTVTQIGQLKNPDARVTLENSADLPLLLKYADSYWGIGSGDVPRFASQFWEIPDINKNWKPLHVTSAVTCAYTGREQIIDWRKSRLELCVHEYERALWLANRWNRGSEGWGHKGVAVSQMGGLGVTLFSGDIYQNGVAAIIPKDQAHLPAIWAFCSSDSFCTEVRKIDKKLSVTNLTLIKVPFDLARWQKVAAEKYPHGLPKPFSSDPTQWLFNGHPAGATVAAASSRSSAEGKSLEGSATLQVAVARLLGYQWPRQTGSSFPDCPALALDGLETLADNDGIVCLSATKGEAAAAERLRELLARAYGKDWNATTHTELLAQVDYAGATLEDWLRNGFFEQHCKLFHHRPFIWHIWDGHKNGFSALVNYHKLCGSGFQPLNSSDTGLRLEASATLEKLTYAYLGDWIRRQQSAVDAEEAGSDARLQAAKQLQTALKLILEGEPPHDLFVRWKPLSQQSIGWHPDLNDGVRMNIRPFATADILRKRVKIKWEKDRGKEPQRDKKEFPWFWNGSAFTGDRVNDVHLTREQKEKATK